MKKYTVGLVMSMCLLLPLGASAQSSAEVLYQQQLRTLISLLQQQVIALQAQLVDLQDVERERTPTRDISIDSFIIGDEAQVLAQYFVDDAADMDPIDNRTHRNFLDRFADLVPESFHDHFNEYVVYQNGGETYDAFVETEYIVGEAAEWRLGINASLFELELDHPIVTQLFVHEFGHVLELYAYGDAPSGTNCHRYFSSGFGCIDTRTLEGQFVEEFWSSRDLREAIRIRESQDLFAAIEDFYEVDPDRFVTEYAASAPGEDFTESFVVFVLDNRPTGDDEKDQKVEFFYGFDELVQIRSDIRSSL